MNVGPAAVRAAALLCLVAGVPAAGQEPGPTPAPPLFASDEPLSLTVEADLARLEGDRSDASPERPAHVVLAAPDGSRLRLEAQLRTRGNFRRERANCRMPPLRLNLKKKQVPGTIFAGQDKLKIVGSCRPGRDAWVRLVLREYLAYRILQAVTHEAFRVRLARITWVDVSGESEPWTEFAFFIEDDDALAERLGGAVFELDEGRNLPPAAFEAHSATRLAVFAYMIGSTDWSAEKGHNVEIVESPRGGLPIPYDFDFSGLVDAPYATPDPAIGIRTVRERRFLGWCRGDEVARAILGEFRTAQAETIRIIEGFVHLDEGDRRAMLDYLEEFHRDIETDRRAELTFLSLCRTMPGR